MEKDNSTKLLVIAFLLIIVIAILLGVKIVNLTKNKNRTVSSIYTGIQENGERATSTSSGSKKSS